MQAVYHKTKEAIREWAVRHAYGPYAAPFLFFFSYAEALFLPAPVETALVPLVLIKARSWLYYVAVATFGSLAGGITGYFIGLLFYETIGVLVVNAYSFEEEIQRISQLLADHVFWATFVAAFTPLPDKVFMPLAGLLRTPFLSFVVALFLGRALRFAVVGFLADRYGAAATRLALKYFREVTLALVVLAALVLWWWFR